VKFLLDTNTVIQIIAGHCGLIARLSKHSPGDFAISSVVMLELYFGAYNSKKILENLARIDALQFDILSLSDTDAKVAGSIRADLKAKGTPIGAYDLLIAGQAIARSLTLITGNVKEFRRVKDLSCQDWSSGG